MSINISSSFKLGGAIPIDERYVFPSLTQANALGVSYRYLGLMSFIQDQQKYYYLKDNINTWEEFKTGSGASDGLLKDWLSGSNYLQYQGSIYNGVIYRAKIAITNSTINPLSDSDNWEALNVNATNTFDKTKNTTDDITEGTNNKFMTVAEKTKLESIGNVFQFKGQISANTDFPLTTDVKSGWVYEIKVDVTDNDATKTNTGLAFLKDDEIAWNGTTWISLGLSQGDMKKVIYDTNNDGKVDKAEVADNALKFNGQDATYYATTSDLNGKINKIASPVQDELVIANSDGTIINSGKKISDITKGSEISLDITNFNKNLTATENTVQKAMEKIDDLALSTTYTTPKPVVQGLGGILTGKTYSNADLTTVLNDLLFPYIAPTVSLVSSVAGGIRKYGNIIASIDLTATTSKKSNDISSVKFFKNGTEINTVASPNMTGGTEIYTENNIINDTCTFTAQVGDGTQTVTSNEIKYTFVNPYYIGSLATNTPVDTDILGLSELVKIKSDTSYSYTLTNSRFAISYPTAYGDLTKITDQNLFDITNDFTKTVIPLTIAGTVVNYNVYIFNNLTTQDGFQVTFKH